MTAPADLLVELNAAAAEIDEALTRGVLPSSKALRVVREVLHAHAHYVQQVRVSLPPLVVR